MVDNQPVGYSDVPVLLECEDKECSYCFKKEVICVVEILSGIGPDAVKRTCHIPFVPMWFSGVKTADDTVHYRESDWDGVSIDGEELSKEITEFASEYGPPVGISVIIQDDEYSLSEISMKGTRHTVTATRNMYKRV